MTIDYGCPVDIVEVADVGVCEKAGVTWVLPGVDGCVITNVAASHVSGSSFPVGVRAVSAQVTDGCGFTRTCNWNVNVRDAQPPVIRMNVHQ